MHAALPTHWLPFVLVGRAQRWNSARTLGVVTIAGLAHIATTAMFGALVVAAGLALNQWIEGFLQHISAILLFLFGAFYIARGMLKRTDEPGATCVHMTEPAVSDRAAVVGLVVMMGVMPGEVLLPIYLSTAQEGVTALAFLTLAFALGTVAGMTLFTGLAAAGASVLRLERWARYEGLILGFALIGIGLMIALHQH